LVLVYVEPTKLFAAAAVCF